MYFFRPPTAILWVVICCGLEGLPEAARGQVYPTPTTQSAEPSLPQLVQNASIGDVQAQVELARRYARGLGIVRDDYAAATWYAKAAEQGDAVAQLNMGLAYLNGLGVTKDERLGINWIRKSAEQGNLRAEEVFGEAYE